MISLYVQDGPPLFAISIMAVSKPLDRLATTNMYIYTNIRTHIYFIHIAIYIIYKNIVRKIRLPLRRIMSSLTISALACLV